MARKWWTLTAVCTGVFMLLLDITIVNVALPDIERGFHATLSDLQWVIDAYALTLAAFMLTAGSLADLYGRRKLFVVGIGVFTLGSLSCGLATSTLFLVLARGAQGIGGAVMFATSLALLAQAFQGKDRGVAFGVFGAITGVAVAVGPVIGGALTSGVSWRWIFYVNVPIGLVALFVSLMRVEESHDMGARRPDWIGFVTFSAGLAALVFGLIRANADGWGSSTVTGSLAAALALLAAFILAERLQPAPMLDLGLLRVPTFGGGLISAWAISASIFSALTFLVLYLQNVLGFSAIASGIRFLPLTGAIFLTSGIAGRLTAHVPRRALIAPGFLLVGGGMLLMRGLTPDSGWTHLLPGMILAGVGAGLVNVPLVSTAVGVVEPARAGMASGISSTSRQVGIATGVAALGSLFATQVRSSVISHLAATPLAPHAATIAHGISTGGAAHAIGATPPPLRGYLAGVARGALVGGLNKILLVGALIAFAGALAALALVRERDFITADLESAPVTAEGVTRHRQRRMNRKDPNDMSSNPTFGTQIIGRTEKALNAILDRQLAGTGLSEPQWVTLTLGVMGPGSVDHAELVSQVAGALKISDRDAYARIGELADSHLLELAGDDDDGRATVKVTDAGHELHGRIRATVNEITNRLWGDLPEEDLATAGRVLSTVLARANTELAS